ncbi:MAG: DUF2807 domain-containing protein [Bacteroidales bacterium]|nr:DUF2807 domain-containing protein [Bacteroidales bacterium]
MKKLITLFAALSMAFLTAAAADEPEFALTETQTFEVEHFDGLDVSWMYRVELVQATQQKVEVEAPDFLMPYLKVKVRKNTLVLSVSELPRDIRKKVEKGNYRVQATVAVKELSRVDLSGASRMTADGTFRANSFSLQMSGASSLKGLMVSADKMRIQCSGASNFQMSGPVKEMDIDLSGASKGEVVSDTEKMDADLSGSAKLTLTGRQELVRMDVSAAGHVKMNGSVGGIRLVGSGAAKINMEDCPADEANVDLSGASSLQIHVLDKFGISLSGASRCQYKAGDQLQIVKTDVSTGASLKKL